MRPAEIHRDALAKVKAVYPDADRVVDEYPADAYFQEVWDYPDTVCRYCLIKAGDPCAKTSNVFPYCGADSHRLALECATRELFA